jgi:hypothetical protein
MIFNENSYFIFLTYGQTALSMLPSPMAEKVRSQQSGILGP